LSERKNIDLERKERKKKNCRNNIGFRK